MKDLKTFIKTLNSSSALLWDLCNLDLKQRAAGSIFGFFWIYFSPLLSISIIWCVFYFGLKPDASSGGMYSLLIGLMVWQFISDAVFTGLAAFTEKPYLVKKIKFPLELLPVIKIVNSFRIHLPFLFIIIVISLISGHFSVQKMLLFPVLFALTILFLTGAILFLSTAIIFYRDLQNAVGITMQLLFWGTPILWSVQSMPKLVGYVEYFNPFYFIISIYKFSFLNEDNQFFFSLMIFLVLTFLVLWSSVKVFYMLKDQFADVL